MSKLSFSHNSVQDLRQPIQKIYTLLLWQLFNVAKLGYFIIHTFSKTRNVLQPSLKSLNWEYPDQSHKPEQVTCQSWKIKKLLNQHQEEFEMPPKEFWALLWSKLTFIRFIAEQSPCPRPLMRWPLSTCLLEKCWPCYKQPKTSDTLSLTITFCLEFMKTSVVMGTNSKLRCPWSWEECLEDQLGPCSLGICQDIKAANKLPIPILDDHCQWMIRFPRNLWKPISFRNQLKRFHCAKRKCLLLWWN